jgi:hypothetical protein
MKFAYILTLGFAEAVAATWNLMPRATNPAADYVQEGYSPKPTGAVYDLAKALNPAYQICGYIGGDRRKYNLKNQ